VIACDAAVPLSEAREEAAFGGKAVQLGAAVRAGLPVPDGFALPVELVEAVAADEPSATATLSALHDSFPGPLAARSSCVGEDSAAASFAGQHHTRLNVGSREQLHDAVVAIWESGRSQAALAYRAKLGLEGEPRMGVVVQRLVEADVSGVLFTRNPVNGADERLIEATWGLGESVVQGLVTPDLFRLSRTGEVLERRHGRKETAIRTLPGGDTINEPVPAHLMEAFCLDDERLRLLHGLALRCEKAFDGPSDIEWTFAGSTLFLLQRREITSTP
jgi:pyruvate,water dikinase